jgi:hypothetical protein
MSSPVCLTKNSEMNPFPFIATKFFTSAINSSLGRMWPPRLPMSALMILSVVFISPSFRVRLCRRSRGGWIEFTSVSR